MTEPIQCEGWTRKGGAFTLGPVQWSQCENNAIVNLEVTQDGKTDTQPSCQECWNTAIEMQIPIASAIPLPV